MSTTTTTTTTNTPAYQPEPVDVPQTGEDTFFDDVWGMAEGASEGLYHTMGNLVDDARVTSRDAFEWVATTADKVLQSTANTIGSSVGNLGASAIKPFFPMIMALLACVLIGLFVIGRFDIFKMSVNR